MKNTRLYMLGAILLVICLVLCDLVSLDSIRQDEAQLRADFIDEYGEWLWH